MLGIWEIYDDRFLVKPVKLAKDLMPEAEMELPYEEGRKMMRIDNIGNKEFLKKLLESMYDKLPAPKKKR